MDVDTKEMVDEEQQAVFRVDDSPSSGPCGQPRASVSHLPSPSSPRREACLILLACLAPVADLNCGAAPAIPNAPPMGIGNPGCGHATLRA